MCINYTKCNGRNNSFTLKLVFFHDICSSVNVPSETKMKAFLIILKELTLDYYYSNKVRINAHPLASTADAKLKKGLYLISSFYLAFEKKIPI